MDLDNPSEPKMSKGKNVATALDDSVARDYPQASEPNHLKSGEVEKDHIESLLMKDNRPTENFPNADVDDPFAKPNSEESSPSSNNETRTRWISADKNAPHVGISKFVDSEYEIDSEYEDGRLMRRQPRLQEADSGSTRKKGFWRIPKVGK